jgi:hypothetical protein
MMPVEINQKQTAAKGPIYQGSPGMNKTFGRSNFSVTTVSFYSAEEVFASFTNRPAENHKSRRTCTSACQISIRTGLRFVPNISLFVADLRSR